MLEGGKLTAKNFLPYKICSRRMRNDPRLVSHVEQTAHGFAAIRPIVESTLVHIHTYKFVGELGVEVASELHGIGQSLITVVERVSDTLPQSNRNPGHHLRPETSAYCISSQRQRQAGHSQPPLAQIYNAMQPALVVGQLAFMNDEACVVLALQHLRDDLVERHHIGLDARREQPQNQIGGSQPTRHSDTFALDLAL